jgi:phosphoribosylglycinamide formyltransferase-1
MMHKVIPELDRGPAVTSCRFPIRGYQFDSLWQQLPQDQEELSRFIKQGLSEREKTQHPLHKKIREHGLTHEFPLIIQTTKSFAEGKLKIEGSSILDCEGKLLKCGLDLTRQIDEIVKPILEGKVRVPERR